MDPCLPYYDQTYFASAYQHSPAISVTNYGSVNPPIATTRSPVQLPRQQLFDPQAGHGDQPTSLSDDEDSESLNSDVLPELTIKIYGRVGAGGKNYVLRNVMVGNISSTATFRRFVVHEFGNKVWRGKKP